MELLKGAELLKVGARGEVVAASAEAVLTQEEEEEDGGRMVCFLFAARFCPPCRKFIEVLKRWYQALSSERPFVILVPLDKTDSDALEHLSGGHLHAEWTSVRRGTQAHKFLIRKFYVTSIPMLIVCDLADGSVVTRDGRTILEEEYHEGNPMKVIEKWRDQKWNSF